MPSYQLEPELPRGDFVAGDPAGRKEDLFLLGKLTEAGAARRLWLDATGEQVVGVLGKRGSGKSYTLGVMIEALASGKGETPISRISTPRAALVLDIMDIFWTSKISLNSGGSKEIEKQRERMAKAGYSSQELSIDVWIPAGHERPEIDPQEVNKLRIQASDLELDDWGDLFGLDVYGEPRGMLIADLVNHVGIEGYSREGGGKVPAKVDYSFQDLLDCLESDADLAANYKEDTRRSIRQRMTSYANLDLFQGEGTPLTKLLVPFRVSVLMLARVPDALKRVLVAVIVRRVMRERRDASFAQKRLDLDSTLDRKERSKLEQFISQCIPRTWLVLDEAHVLAGTGPSSVAAEALIKYAKEGRNYGLSMAVATQQPSALDTRLTSQAETLILHQLTSPADAAIATQNIRSPLPTSMRVDGAPATVDSLLRRLPQGEMVFSCGNAPTVPRMCIAAVRPRISAHGGYEA